MSTVVALLAVLGLVAALLALAKGKGSRSKVDGPWPFQVKPVLSEVELKLYGRLRDALPGHIVLAQVQLSRVIEAKSGDRRRSWMNRISQKSADFVVCRPDASVVAVIELDDRSHEKPDRRSADDAKDRALEGAGVQVVRWQARAMPDVEGIRTWFSSSGR